jgi:hypothetical protein
MNGTTTSKWRQEAIKCFYGLRCPLGEIQSADIMTLD